MMSFARFLLALWPPLQELARALYEAHRGNVDAAKAELRTIRDHGRRLEVVQAEVDRRMAEVAMERERERAKAREADDKEGA